MPEKILRWVTPIPQNRAEFDKAIAAIRTNPDDNAFLSFGALPMVHFASLTLFDQDPHKTNPVLVFECNIDKPYQAYLETLVKVGRRGLDALYADCARYPAKDSDASEIVRFLKQLNCRPPLYHIGHPNRSVQEIRGDYELRRSIVHELETNAELRNRSPVQIRQYIREKTKCPSLPWPSFRCAWHDTWKEPLQRLPLDEITGREPPKPAPPTPLDEITWKHHKLSWSWFGRTLLLLGLGWFAGFSIAHLAQDLFEIPYRVTTVVFGVVVFLIVRLSAPDSKVFRGLVVATVLWILMAYPFKWHPFPEPWEWWSRLASLLYLLPLGLLLYSYFNIARTIAVTRPVPPLDDATKQRVAKLLDAEDRNTTNSIYNHVAGLSVLTEKYQLSRRIRTRLVLSFLNLFYRTQYVKGKLATIPSIHFAQWSLVGQDRLLFLTNYDGGADSYLDDFFNSLAGGVAYIWHDTTIFPRTTDPRILKLWVRSGQTLAAVRYRAPIYEDLTVTTINSNAYLRKRLLRGFGEASARRWLARLTSTPVEPPPFRRLLTLVKEQFI
jgi:hypothetical protein